ncbi:hypothetical protein [Bacillus pretiosus]|uniref:hypothetical protein n=1 Tax=Bacillus TaxID=1386 RepID=UPI003D64FFEA
MRSKLIGILVCMIVMICISITYIDQSIGTASENKNYESSKRAVKKDNRENERQKS